MFKYILAGLAALFYSLQLSSLMMPTRAAAKVAASAAVEAVFMAAACMLAAFMAGAMRGEFTRDIR